MSSHHRTTHESCGGSPSLLSFAQQLRAFGLLCLPAHRLAHQTVRGAAANATAIVSALKGGFSAFLTLSPITTNLAQARHPTLDCVTSCAPSPGPYGLRPRLRQLRAGFLAWALSSAGRRTQDRRRRS